MLVYRLQTVYGGAVTYYPANPDNPLTKVVSWRVSAGDWEELSHFLETFEAPGAMAAAMRWLLARPEVRQVMNSRIDEHWLGETVR